MLVYIAFNKCCSLVQNFAGLDAFIVKSVQNRGIHLKKIMPDMVDVYTLLYFLLLGKMYRAACLVVHVSRGGLDDWWCALLFFSFFWWEKNLSLTNIPFLFYMQQYSYFKMGFSVVFLIMCSCERMLVCSLFRDQISTSNTNIVLNIIFA